MGPIMMDVAGTSLTDDDKALLTHPWVGGLILFARNYESPEQIQQLTTDIKAASGHDILIAVDHEGGRVQRFRDGFSVIPAMGSLWETSQGLMEVAEKQAFYAGQLMALEVISVGVDISFAPVVDLNGISEVIGDRAFHHTPDKVSALALSFIQGMKHVGMKSTVKHFPGHGSVKEDSHIALPVDTRSKQEILGCDMQPFRHLMSLDMVDAVMPAHVIYSELDDKSVGFSHFWLQQMLRKELAFDGVIFSDDLSMAGAGSIGGHIERSEAAQEAGCDMLLLCNDRDELIKVIDKANLKVIPESQHRLRKMMNKSQLSYQQLSQLSEWSVARSQLGLSVIE